MTGHNGEPMLFVRPWDPRESLLSSPAKQSLSVASLKGECRRKLKQAAGQAVDHDGPGEQALSLAPERLLALLTAMAQDNAPDTSLGMAFESSRPRWPRKLPRRLARDGL